MDCKLSDLEDDLEVLADLAKPGPLQRTLSTFEYIFALVDAILHLVLAGDGFGECSGQLLRVACIVSHVEQNSKRVDHAGAFARCELKRAESSPHVHEDEALRVLALEPHLPLFVIIYHSAITFLVSEDTLNGFLSTLEVSRAAKVQFQVDELEETDGLLDRTVLQCLHIVEPLTKVEQVVAAENQLSRLVSEKSLEDVVTLIAVRE